MAVLPHIQLMPSKGTVTTQNFLGLNQNLTTNEGEWSKMRNISDRFYPVIASRPNRGAIEQTMTKPKGIFYKNGLFYIDGTKAYYKGAEKFTVSDTDKLIVGLGAYICVFPDGKIYNTYKDTTEDITASYRQSGTVTFAPLSDKSVYTKITASGIGNTFAKGDNVTISGCTTSSYNGTHIITEQGTDYIVISGQLTSSFTQSSGLTFERKMPELDFVTEKDNRLYGCSSANHEVYTCKQGDPKNWYNYESGADMAWAATVGSDGDFTACTKYSSSVLFFKENAVHILRGEKPSNYSLNEKELPGVRKGCDRSVVTIDDTLYYVGRNGVYAYDGAIPQKISSNITDDISDAVACKYNSKLYISCKLAGATTLLVYDPRTGLWDAEDEETFRFAAFSDGMLHYIDADNRLTSIEGSRTETIEWFLETGDRTDGILNMKRLSKIKLNLWLAAGTEFRVLIRYDDEPIWQSKGYIRSTVNKTYTLPITPRRCSKYRIRLEGTGEFKLLGMSRDIEQGSEINGSLQYQYHR